MANANAGEYITLCMRCRGTGRYDRGACFGCRPYGSTGWVRKPKRSSPVAQVTAIRDPEEGRIDWIKVYGASPRQGKELVQRMLRIANLSAALIESVDAYGLENCHE